MDSESLEDGQEGSIREEWKRHNREQYCKNPDEPCAKICQSVLPKTLELSACKNYKIPNPFTTRIHNPSRTQIGILLFKNHHAIVIEK